MNYTRFNLETARVPARAGTLVPHIERVSRFVIWVIVNAGLLFLEHAAELAAPFLILGGVVWYAVPQALSAITLEGQANDILQMVRVRFPHELVVGGSVYTASTLIADGILCIAIIAICRTLSTAITSFWQDNRG